MIKRKFLLILVLFIFGNRIAHCENVSSVSAYICRGHALIGIRAVEKTYKIFYGFYPPGRIANELRENLYKFEMLEACQSVKVDLTEEQWIDLKIILANSRMLFDEWGSKEEESRFGRSSAYNVFKFNCVDFAQMIMGRFTGESLVETFAKQNNSLSLFSFPLEPCVRAGGPEYCLRWGLDLGKFWAYYRSGTLNLLQAFFLEKPKAVSTAIAVTGSALWGCHHAGYSYSYCFASIALMDGAVALYGINTKCFGSEEFNFSLYMLAPVAMMAHFLIYSMNPARPLSWRAIYGVILSGIFLNMPYNEPDPMSQLVYPN